MDTTLFQESLQTHALGRTFAHFDSLDSTSTYIRSLVPFMGHGFTVLADEQLSGRGRSGKSFYSPKNDGLYFSFIIKEACYLNDPLFTIRISYAVCLAIDRLTDTMGASIKWVNDIYCDTKKIAGILCEAPAGQKAYIVGIGVNFTVDKAVVPHTLRYSIGSLHDLVSGVLSKERLCAGILNELEEMYASPLDNEAFLEAYRRRSAVLGKEILVLKNNEEKRAAALAIAPDGGLVVRYPDGITEKLVAGEVSLKV